MNLVWHTLRIKCMAINVNRIRCDETDAKSLTLPKFYRTNSYSEFSELDCLFTGVAAMSLCPSIGLCFVIVIIEATTIYPIYPLSSFEAENRIEISGVVRLNWVLNSFDSKSIKYRWYFTSFSQRLSVTNDCRRWIAMVVELVIDIFVYLFDKRQTIRIVVPTCSTCSRVEWRAHANRFSIQHKPFRRNGIIENKVVYRLNTGMFIWSIFVHFCHKFIFIHTNRMNLCFMNMMLNATH